MNDGDRHLQREIDRVTDENQLLRNEVSSLRRFIRSLQKLTDAADRGQDPVDIMEVLEQILRDSLDAIDAQDGSLLVLDEDTEELVFVLAHGDVPQEKIAGIRLPPGKGIAGWVARHREPTIVQNPHTDQRFYGGLDDSFQFHTHSILAAPIIGGGRVLGVVEALNKELGRSFSADDLTVLMLVCRFAGELLHTLEERAKRMDASRSSPGAER